MKKIDWISRHLPQEKTVPAYLGKKLARLPLTRSQAAFIPFHEVSFVIDNKWHKFKVDQHTFSQLPERAKGRLTYQGARLIRFVGDGFDVSVAKDRLI